MMSIFSHVLIKVKKKKRNMFVDMARKNLVKLTFGELCRIFVQVLEYSVSSSET